MTSGVRRPEWATPKRCKGPRCRRWVPWEACRDRHQYKLKDTCSASCAGAYGRAQRPDTGQRQPHRCALPECEQWVARREGECDSSYRSRRYHDEGCRKVARARGQVNRRKKERPVRVCGCGCGRSFTSKRREQRFATHDCSVRARTRAAQPKGEPSALATGVPGASRAGRRRPPKIVGARAPRIGGNAASDPPMQPRRSVFPDEAVTALRRLGQVPVVERRERTVPRPSFGLSRRSA